jgi:hypothetical protein
MVILKGKLATYRNQWMEWDALLLAKTVCCWKNLDSTDAHRIPRSKAQQSKVHRPPAAVSHCFPTGLAGFTVAFCIFASVAGLPVLHGSQSVTGLQRWYY